MQEGDRYEGLCICVNKIATDTTSLPMCAQAGWWNYEQKQEDSSDPPPPQPTLTPQWGRWTGGQAAGSSIAL